MNNQQILDNAPEGAVSVDDANDYFDAEGRLWSDYHKCFESLDMPEMPVRSIKDIERIAELENKLIAPTDSGIDELDAICERFNSDETSNLIKLVSEVWNKALVTPYSTKWR